MDTKKLNVLKELLIHDAARDKPTSSSTEEEPQGKLFIALMAFTKKSWGSNTHMCLLKPIDMNVAVFSSHQLRLLQFYWELSLERLRLSCANWPLVKHGHTSICLVPHIAPPVLMMSGNVNPKVVTPTCASHRLCLSFISVYWAYNSNEHETETFFFYWLYLVFINASSQRRSSLWNR